MPQVATFTLFAPIGPGPVLTAFHRESKSRRSLNCGSGDLIIQPLAVESELRCVLSLSPALRQTTSPAGSVLHPQHQQRSAGGSLSLRTWACSCLTPRQQTDNVQSEQFLSCCAPRATTIMLLDFQPACRKVHALHGKLLKNEGRHSHLLPPDMYLQVCPGCVAASLLVSRLLCSQP